MTVTLTSAELDYLRSQRLGRLATVDAAGAPQNNPVGYSVDDATGDLVIGGWAMDRTRKFRNVQGNERVALVVDDLASTDPWVVRGVELRGRAEAVLDGEPPMPGMSGAVIRFHPEWIASWGVEPGRSGMDIRR